MRSAPAVSVVVPARNAGRFVLGTLESIRRQLFQSWECIVVDDGSSDDTAAAVEGMARKDGRFRLVRQSCGGASVARNRGFMESFPFSPYVVFMDADDLWEERALGMLVDRLEGSPDAVGVHGLAEMIDAEGRPLAPGNFSAFGRRRLGYRDGRMEVWPLAEPTGFETLVWSGPLYPPGLLLARRTAYEVAGLYDPSLSQCEDWDMCLRLSRLGPIEFVDDVILYYRRHASNASNDVNSNRSAVRRLHFKTFFSPLNDARQRRILREGWRAWQRFKMSEKWEEAKLDIRRGLPWRVGRLALDFPVHIFRYLRGCPSRSGL